MAKKTRNRTRDDDYRELSDQAANATLGAPADGNRGGKHPAGAWRGESIDEQITHIQQHIAAPQRGVLNEDHLTHIVCRAAIAMALQEREASSPSVIPTEAEGSRAVCGAQEKTGALSTRTVEAGPICGDGSQHLADEVRSLGSARDDGKRGAERGGRGMVGAAEDGRASTTGRDVCPTGSGAGQEDKE
jgi:hypothetical protein